ncbi:hypothetical protein VSU19_20430 [Verrucomicrobiales bacterium BCK34]|nr:hypothetical protein [Verrucomicrobiales bacterium BCK34]
MKPDTSNADETPGWFDRKENVRKVLAGLSIGCGVLVLIDVIFWVTGYDKHPYLKWEKWPGFYAVYGFVSCVLLTMVAKYLLRPLVMRDENFYGEKAESEEMKGGSDNV